MIDEVLVSLASLVDYLTELLVTFVRHSFLVSVEDVTPDVPEPLWLVFKEVFHDELIEADKFFFHDRVMIPKTIGASECGHTCTFERFTT